MTKGIWHQILDYTTYGVLMKSCIYIQLCKELLKFLSQIVVCMSHVLIKKWWDFIFFSWYTKLPDGKLELRVKNTGKSVSASIENSI